MIKKIILLLLVILTNTLVACDIQEAPPILPESTQFVDTSNATTVPEITEIADLPAYPTPGEFAYPEPSNYNAPSAYPSPVEDDNQTTLLGLIPFQISKPIIEGSVQVAGTGTPGVPLVLVNVTMVGELLGETVVGDDGKFTFQIQPLDSGIRIGVVIGNLDGTPWSTEDFYDTGYYGDEARVVPMIGFLYDTALVEDK